jgi:hypothetical protein
MPGGALQNEIPVPHDEGVRFMPVRRGPDRFFVYLLHGSTFPKYGDAIVSG